MISDAGKYITFPVNIKCQRDTHFDANFEYKIPYNTSNGYKISTLIKDLKKYVNDKNKPFAFRITKIEAVSFIE